MENNQQPEELYDVAKYFDDHFERNVAVGKTKEEANKIADQYNDKQPRAYVKYLVRKSETL